MKKILTALLAAALLLSLCACGGKTGTPAGTEAPKPETAAAPTPAPDAPKATEAPKPEATPEPTPEPTPAIPEGYEEVEIVSEFYGVKVTFAGLNDGRFADKDVKLDTANLKQGTTNWEVKYVSDKEWRNKDYLSYKFQIYPDSGANLERDMKNGVVLEGLDYTAFLSEEIGESKCKITFMTDENSFYDGRMSVIVDMVAYAGFMSAEDFRAAAETLIDTLRIELSDSNGMNGDDGSFLSYSGLYAVPAKLSVDGSELETYWTVVGRRARAAVRFTDADGKPVTIVEMGKNVPKYVGSRYDDEEHYRHVQFGDVYGICDSDPGPGNINHEYTVVFAKDGDNETNMSFQVILGEQGGMSYQELRHFFSDAAQEAEMDARMDAYAPKYLSQISVNP